MKLVTATLLRLSCFLLAATPVCAQPLVVATIRPLELIAMAVTGDLSEPRLVLEITQDPHHPALKPSQRRAMNQATVFLWIGPDLETGMEGVVSGLAAHVITAQELRGLSLLQSGAGPDPHLWLDSRNAGAIATELAGVLAKLDPANAATYKANLDSFLDGLLALESEITAILQPADFPPFAVFHNALGYFENQFGLAHAASFTDNEEVLPGIRQVMAIKETLASQGAKCLLVGPGVDTRALDNQLGLDGMRYVTIDVLAHDVVAGHDAYVQFLHDLARRVAGCRN